MSNATSSKMSVMITSNISNDTRKIIKIQNNVQAQNTITNKKTEINNVTTPSSNKETKIRLTRRGVILGTIIAVVIAAPIARVSSAGIWIAEIAMILYLAYNSAFVSENFKQWNKISKSSKFRLVIWSIAVVSTATTILRHDFLFFTTIAILAVDYLQTLSKD